MALVIGIRGKGGSNETVQPISVTIADPERQDQIGSVDAQRSDITTRASQHFPFAGACVVSGALTPVAAAIDANLAALKAPGVLTVRPGYVLDAAGWPTQTPAIVVTVDPEQQATAPALPTTLGGFEIDVRAASSLQLMRATQPARFAQMMASAPPEFRQPFFASERTIDDVPMEAASVIAAEASRGLPKIPYEPPANAPLDPVSGSIKVTVCASPDAGWNVLKPFLEATRHTLDVGLYDFTSAHILETATTVLAGKDVALVLDHPAKNPTADQTDEQTKAALMESIGDKLTFAWALERADPFAGVWIYPNAYHIKVAVRDDSAFWLSSGNWNNSNQPQFDFANPDRPLARKSDRDWHVVVEYPDLAKTFKAFITNDLAVAEQNQSDGIRVQSFADVMSDLAVDPVEAEPFTEFFGPQTFEEEMSITPLLTPDPGIYVGRITDLIRNATTSFWIQTQYVHPSGLDADAPFDAMIAELVAAQGRGVDVRLIMSQFETMGKTPWLEKLQSTGFDLGSARIQGNVHNKGMIVDDHITVVSSQNWSADGVLRNRDAGVIIYNANIAAYFRGIFDHDWNHLAKQAAL